MQWTPVNEYPPQTRDNREHVKVLITYLPKPVDGYVFTEKQITENTTVLPAYYNFNERRFEQFFCGGFIQGTVTAWMYFPEPYFENKIIEEVAYEQQSTEKERD